MGVGLKEKTPLILIKECNMPNEPTQEELIDLMHDNEEPIGYIFNSWVKGRLSSLPCKDCENAIDFDHMELYQGGRGVSARLFDSDEKFVGVIYGHGQTYEVFCMECE
jgi:hypothetical protein